MRILIVGVCSLLGGCALSTSNDVQPRPLVKPGDVYIARRGGACLGSCPDYDVYIFKDGRVAFRGNRFTAADGLRTKRIRRDQFQKLQAAIQESNFFSAPEPTECLTDQPAVSIEVNFGEGVRQRSVDSGCRSDRENLWPTVDMIDEIAGVGRWASQRGSWSHR